MMSQPYSTIPFLFVIFRRGNRLAIGDIVSAVVTNVVSYVGHVVIDVSHVVSYVGLGFTWYAVVFGFLIYALDFVKLS